MRNGSFYHNPMSNLPLPLFSKIGNDQEAIETAPQFQSKRTIRFSPHNSSTPRRIQRDRPLISSSPSLSSPRRNEPLKKRIRKPRPTEAGKATTLIYFNHPIVH